MSRLLDIIVPHYNENWEIVRPFFSVLNAQRGVDFSQFRVWLVHNGDVPEFPKECFAGSPVDIVQKTLKEKGVSVARNWGIDHADATWIAFCDCDDCYTSVFSLMNILYVLGNPGTDVFDMMWAPFYMHMGDKLQNAGKMNSVFVHNKYYRLSFLKEKKLRFNESLRMSEDSAFNGILMMEIDKSRIGQINTTEPLYAWCRRPGSITMDVTKWVSNTEGHFERNLYMIEEYKKRGLDGIDRVIARTITDVYAMLTRKVANGNMAPLLCRVGVFYRKNKKAYYNVAKKDLKIALEASDRDCCVTDEDRRLRPTLAKWIRDNLE